MRESSTPKESLILLNTLPKKVIILDIRKIFLYICEQCGAQETEGI